MQQLIRESGSPKPSTTWPVCAPPLANSWIRPCVTGPFLQLNSMYHCLRLILAPEQITPFVS